MTSQANGVKYIPTIGIETHVQLKTVTKLFSAVANDAREAPANTLISPVCMGLPGALPVLNEAAVHVAIKAAFALGTEPQPFSKFDRKHYFYPDLPKGYQITQYDQPIIVGGSIEFEVDGESKRIGITRAHLEEDAGKSMHPAGKDYSLVDLNRAGTPLLEIVSEPEMHSSAEAKAYAKELYLRMKYAGVSDADLFYGNMRFDVNVSVSREPGKLGTRTETKNLNSFRAIEKAVEYEISRQTELLEKGQAIIQETRGWDDAKQKTFSQREKEEAHDYRYFPEPDLPPIVLSPAMIERAKREMPVMPDEWRERLAHLGLDRSQTSTLLEAEVEEGGTHYLQIIDALSEQKDTAKSAANLMVNVEIPLRRSGKVAASMNDEERQQLYEGIIGLAKAGKLSSTGSKSLLETILTSGAKPKAIEQYAEQQGFIQVSDEKEIAAIVKEVISNNPTAVKDIQGGEMKAIGFLVGQIMKASQGKANPQLAQKLINEQLNL